MAIHRGHSQAQSEALVLAELSNLAVPLCSDHPLETLIFAVDLPNIALHIGTKLKELLRWGTAFVQGVHEQGLQSVCNGSCTGLCRMRMNSPRPSRGSQQVRVFPHLG